VGCAFPSSWHTLLEANFESQENALFKEPIHFICHFSIPSRLSLISEEKSSTASVYWQLHIWLNYLTAQIQILQTNNSQVLMMYTNYAAEKCTT
jgi:hypothetical protein